MDVFIIYIQEQTSENGKLSSHALTTADVRQWPSYTLTTRVVRQGSSTIIPRIFNRTISSLAVHQHPDIRHRIFPGDVSQHPEYHRNNAITDCPPNIPPVDSGGQSPHWLFPAPGDSPENFPKCVLGESLCYTVKTNALKKRVVVLIGKIIFFIINWFSKLVTYILIPVAISI